jgi:hypothetical protein
MRKDATTNFLLIAFALIAIASDAARARRQPASVRKSVGDMRTGKVYGFPTFSSGTYPVNGADGKPRTSHPFVLGKFAFDDTDK